MRTFGVLIVEDDPQLLHMAVALLKRALPGITVDSAEDVASTRKTVESALAAGRRYDLAILDFRLPGVPGANEEVDESACHLISRSMTGTVVCHISGFIHDPKVIRHIALFHEGQTLGFILDKSSPSFGRELVIKTKQALYGAEVGTRIRDLFLQTFDNKLDGSTVRNYSLRSSGSATSRLMELSIDIGSVWSQLNATTQTLVREYFEVHESVSGVQVVKR